MSDSRARSCAPLPLTSTTRAVSGSHVLSRFLHRPRLATPRGRTSTHARAGRQPAKHVAPRTYRARIKTSAARASLVCSRHSAVREAQTACARSFLLASETRCRSHGKQSVCSQQPSIKGNLLSAAERCSHWPPV
eukprot:6195271-Pleurochrysis_carterae.AAC.1